MARMRGDQPLTAPRVASVSALFNSAAVRLVAGSPAWSSLRAPWNMITSAPGSA
jgi:hypothetical protein